jgi:hypothetical protein
MGTGLFWCLVAGYEISGGLICAYFIALRHWGLSVRLFGYWSGEAAPEKRALLRMASILMVAYIIGVFVILLCFWDVPRLPQLLKSPVAETL